MILNILNSLENNNKLLNNNKKKYFTEENKKINTIFSYSRNLLINKQDVYLKKIIMGLNKMTSHNYHNIYFENIDIFTDTDLDLTEIIKLIYKKILQNSDYIDVYINFILLNENLTITFINFIQNIFENNLENNILIINIIHYLHSKNILDNNLFKQIIHFLFSDTKKYINHLIQLYLCSKNIEIKNKILQIPNLSYRYKFKLEV